jgi:uncharacterized protein
MKLSKTIILFLIASFLITSCTKTVVDYYPSGRIKSQIQYRNGKEDGVSKYFNENYGSVVLEINMKKGMKEGSLKRFYFNGNLEYEANYINDQLDGIEKNYTKKGLIVTETMYKKGIKDGPYRSWHENGVQFTIGAYKNDLQNGKWEFYDERGFLMGEATFNMGTGEQFAYDQNGVVKRKTLYKKGMKEGEETYYLPDGSIEKVLVFKEDRITEER